MIYDSYSACNPYCTIENTNEVNDLINSFKNYNIGDTYNFGDGDYQVTSKYGGSTEQSGILEGNTYETIRFSSNSDDTNSIWVEFNYSETSGDHLFTYLGRRDTSSTNIWSYVRRYYSPGYEIAPGPFNHYYNINYCNYWIDMIYDLSIIPSVD